MGEESNIELSRLASALRGTTRLEPRHVWRVLTVPEREAALRRVVEGGSDGDTSGRTRWRRTLISVALASSKGFRPTTIREWSLDQLVAYVARLSDPGAASLIEPVVLEHHGPEVLARVQAPLLGRLSIRHNAGVVDDDALDELGARTGDVMCVAALDAWREQPTREMAIYLMALAVVFPARWQALHAILPTIADELTGVWHSDGSTGGWVRHAREGAHILPVRGERETHDAAGPSTSRTEDGEGPLPDERVALLEESDEPPGDLDDDTLDQSESVLSTPTPPVANSETAVLSALDEELIKRVVDSLQDVVGAPSESQLDAVIGELIRLNSTRHQSFYVHGLHDAVRRRPDRTVLPAQNAHRWRWYMAGYVAGLARLDDSEAICALWERRPEVRSLGDTGQGPSRYAVVHVVKALQACERWADVVAFAAPDAIARNEVLANLVLATGTALQRQQRLTEASPVFEKLLLAEARSRVLDGNFWATVKRRHAHCMRGEGKLEAAKRLLGEALDDADPSEQAMVMVDLGLIDAGFGRLSDLRLPSSFELAEGIAARLDRGLPRFREAQNLGVGTSSHAHYVLGMRELLRRRYAEAEQLLSLAVLQFDLERERYEPAQLLRRAHLHTAVARCANMDSDASRLEQAMHDIVNALVDPRDFPDVFAEEVIAGLSLRDDVQSDQLVERLLTERRDALLDALVADEKARRSVAVADALAARFRRSHRTMHERVADGIALVRILVLQGRHDDAEVALEELELLAVRSPHGEAVLTFLSQSCDLLTSVWEPEDVAESQVRVLESLGRHQEAAHILRGAYARALARDDAQGRLDARDIIDTLASYGCVDANELAGMRARAERTLPPMTSPTVRHRSINILVVGGNELQRQYDESIRAHYRECAPWLDVEFMHTGWSSNWGEQVDEFTRRVVRADAVVLIYLMRTMFGRAIRKRMGGRPWRGCGGKGRDSIQRAIDEAIAAVNTA